MAVMYKHIYLNVGVISFKNKEMVTFIQLQTYNFGLVYVLSKNMKISCHFSAVKNRCLLHRRVFVMSQNSI